MIQVAPLSENKNGNPVILLIVDTLMNPTLQAAIQNNEAPAFKFFIEHGKYFPEVVSPFPTMSVNVDTTLLTGTYCDKHHLPGLVWFHQKEKRLINYGTHIRELWRLGLAQCLEDSLINLNNSHISKQTKTIHEELEDKGKSSASINALVYRGNTPHMLKMPKVLQWFLRFPKSLETNSAQLFSYGGMKKINSATRHHHFWQKFGFNDSFSTEELTYLIQENKLPDFTIAYFPDLDQRIHKNGRMDVKGIKKVDSHLQKILNIHGQWENALKDKIWIIMGDNGQAWIHSDKSQALIDLRKLLGSYQIMKLKKGIQPDDQLILAVNERMAYIYPLDKTTLSLQTIVQVLQQDRRIDVIAWREGKYIIVKSGEQQGELRFYPEGNLTDSYGQSWGVEGDKGLLDIIVQENQIHYGQYPDALARLHSCLHSHDGDYLVVSAKPGYEFIGEGSPTHIGGGSHGGLHAQDSLVPLIVAGTEKMPTDLRIVKLKQWVLSLIS